MLNYIQFEIIFNHCYVVTALFQYVVNLIKIMEL